MLVHKMRLIAGLLVGLTLGVGSGAGVGVASPSNPQEVTSQDVARIAQEQTENPAPLRDIKVHSGEGQVISNLALDLSVASLDGNSNVPDVHVLERGSDLQLVSVINSEEQASPAFSFDEMDLIPMEDGGVLLANKNTGIVEFLVEPAWALDATGRSLSTSFAIQGNKLVQEINLDEAVYPVVADPYIRDLRSNGRKIGQEMVFSKWATGLLANGGGVACVVLQSVGGVFGGVACATAVAVANYAKDRGNCFGIRAIGPVDAPNLIFPVSTRC